MRRSARLSAAAGAVAMVTAAVALGPWLCAPPEFRVEGPAAPAGSAAGAPRLSLLAVGDTGAQRLLGALRESQRSVGRGLASEDRRAPVDALVLLGDNFYYEGLLERELVARVRRNLVLPFCHFADLSGPRSPEVADACRTPASERHPVPIHAVLGNHDHNTEESPQLQRQEVPRFLPNWSVPDGDAAVVELPGGVSLVLADSEGIRERGAAALEAALDAARGPWRIVALHHPVALREGGEPSQLQARLRAALARGERSPQLLLSGHRHNLQLIVLDLPRPAIQLIAGSGSNPRALREPAFRGRHYASAAVGFVRIDLVGDGPDEGLLLSLFAMPRTPALFWREPRLVSRWWLARSGEGFQVFPPPAAG